MFVSDAPKVKLSLGAGVDASAVEEGKDVYLDCEVRAFPKEYKITWRHNVSINTF